ncbi:TIGR03557 family F420-dependent LLM class oxidoreductase [Streptomyces gamaensis]|uniref:TIGR03557 family F420-dependent LLM class oxidoreductase n=1 Tax=Streptomyces gamaensis TaxID=1763542 RepID=A0ABW0Z767_9ACTN
MTEFGYFLSCEEHRPADLVEQARMAEQAGFTSLWISDRFHPWTPAQGQAPFVWSVIGAISEATSLPVQTAVTCPAVRLNPVLTAQAAATCAVLLDGGFRLGVGSGKAIDEHILGDPWPHESVRLEMLEEAVQVMRLLFEGGQVSHHGKHYTVEDARLYTVPDEPVPIDVAAFGPAATEVAGRIGDGFLTMVPDADAVARFRRSGGATKLALGGVRVCWGPDRDEAVRVAHRLWAVDQLPDELPRVLPTPEHVEQTAALVPPDRVAAGVTCGTDPDEHIAALRAFADAGFDRVHVGQIGPEQRGFFDFYRTKVLPELAE